MNVNGNIVNLLLTSLSSEASFSDVTFVIAHENEIKPTPLEKPIVAISSKGCTIGDKLTKASDSGELVTTKEREVKTTVSVDIYLPYSMGGIEGHKIFDRLATTLIFVKDFGIIGASCSATDYDSSSQAIVLKSTFVFLNVVDE